ncbi:MAG: hypothetical protein Q7J69_03680 [Candidatus Omnitrophota bacterium]|nr:hypothetical protein [Candidatus Omnitrophota bacterium]
MRIQTRPNSPRVGGGVVLTLLLLCGPLVFAAADDTSKGTFWERHGKVEDPSTTPSFGSGSSPAEAQPIEQTPLTLDNLRIPTQHGSLKGTYTAHEPIIIHIQDAHANYEAQKHLAGILDYLIRAHGLGLVLVEGGSRNDSLSYMRAYAPLEKRKQVAEEFLQSGKISGENYLDLTTDYNFTVYGIEKPELYDQNMEAFFSVEQVQAKALGAMTGFRAAVEALKQISYPEEVKGLELRELEVKEGRVPLAQHYQSLAEEAGKRKVAVADAEFPNLLRFIKASRLEKELNFKAVETERTRFLETLTGSLPKPEMDQLLKQSLELKSGLITPASFYGHLQSHLRPEQHKEYPTLTQYIDYLSLFEGIDHASLFNEVETLSGRVKDSYFKTKSQRKLAQVAKDVGVLEDLLELKLTPDSYDYYRTHKKEFRPDAWADDLRALGAEQKPPQLFALNPGPLNGAMPSMASFYEIARARDEAMVQNALKQVEEFKVPFAVLIAGGFHTPAFERLFRDRKVSYAVVAPKVGKVTPADTEKYHRVLKETYVPMSDKYKQKLGGPAAGPQVSSSKTSSSDNEIRPVSHSESKGLALAALKE